MERGKHGTLLEAMDSNIALFTRVLTHICQERQLTVWLDGVGVVCDRVYVCVGIGICAPDHTSPG